MRVKGDKYRNEEHYTLLASTNKISEPKSRKKKRTGHVAALVN
jgi:hypothetical protein